MSDLLGITVNQLLILTEAETLPTLILLRKKEVIERIAKAHGPGVTVAAICMQKHNLAAILSTLLLKKVDDLESSITALLIYASPDPFRQLSLANLINYEPALIACKMLEAAAALPDMEKPVRASEVCVCSILLYSKPTMLRFKRLSRLWRPLLKAARGPADTLPMTASSSLPLSRSTFLASWRGSPRQ